MTLNVSFVTSKAAANILGVTAQTVRRLVERGDLPAVKQENGYNGRYIIELSEVEHLKTMRELQNAGKATK
ncbi:helix-turn-helix domain-containing protein [Rothia sp. L_38]|uniref:helix-turn-helix domain-containing protein n=1 Tax=Rothia sp. L_38 TaxID=3422315 RepID=UPI003D6C20D6